MGPRLVGYTRKKFGGTAQRMVDNNNSAHGGKPLFNEARRVFFRGFFFFAIATMAIG
jgi:hypothetical protein